MFLKVLFFKGSLASSRFAIRQCTGQQSPSQNYSPKNRQLFSESSTSITPKSLDFAIPYLGIVRHPVPHTFETRFFLVWVRPYVFFKKKSPFNKTTLQYVGPFCGFLRLKRIYVTPINGRKSMGNRVTFFFSPLFQWSYCLIYNW